MHYCRKHLLSHFYAKNTSIPSAVRLSWLENAYSRPHFSAWNIDL